MNWLLIFLCIFGQLTQQQKELDELKKRLNEVRQEIKQLEREKSGTLAHIEKIDEAINLSNEYIEKLTAQEDEERMRIAELNKEIARLESKMKFQKEELKTRLVRLYKWTPFYKLEIIFSSKSIPEILSTSYYLQVLAKNDQKLFFEFRDDWTRYLTDKKMREELVALLENRRIEKEQELSQLNKEREEKRRILDEIARKEKEKKNIEKELKSAQRKLEDLILSLRKKEEKKEAEEKSYFELNKGKLPWPCKGSVGTKFGKVVHPKYNTATKNNGIDILSNYGENVYAVSKGKVVYAGKFIGYGNLVVIDHQDGFYSLYGHLSEILVRVGDEVPGGRIIGRVGESGSLSGPMLHFELRKEGKPVDPLVYLE
jgi:septal ring factor EnvC (AmiA/AmiB activator)|uniref:M23ase beta-sheet core domain-containing protein n=1 Tax=candidate division WOR-3 bacterium TaxID=2052148 RepID=A0A7V3RHY0_UNCW3